MIAAIDACVVTQLIAHDVWTYVGCVCVPLECAAPGRHAYISIHQPAFGLWWIIAYQDVRK